MAIGGLPTARLAIAALLRHAKKLDECLSAVLHTHLC